MTAETCGPNAPPARRGRARHFRRTWQLRLPAVTRGVRQARQATREVLTRWQVAHLEETAVLLVSELTTNAVRHTRTSGTALTLRLEGMGTSLRIEVHDGDPSWPRPRTPAGLDESGFGFVLVDTLADNWGVHETPSGKAVWVELDTRTRSPGGARLAACLLVRRVDQPVTYLAIPCPIHSGTRRARAVGAWPPRSISSYPIQGASPVSWTNCITVPGPRNGPLAPR